VLRKRSSKPVCNLFLLFFFVATLYSSDPEERKNENTEASGLNLSTDTYENKKSRDEGQTAPRI
jgi:hypothetical protein